MNLQIDFGGWFQARLATDPDPFDEPRGVSGYVWALPGEPDLDRIIRFQPDHAVERAGCSPEVSVGVRVASVMVDGRADPGHPLIGARVELENGAKFEGRNGIVAEDGLEPIVPVHVSISGEGVRLERRHADEYSFPFSALRATSMDRNPQAVADATGIADLGLVWGRRVERLQNMMEDSTPAAENEALSARIAFLTRRVAMTMFEVRMHYQIDLAGGTEWSGIDLLAEAADNPWELVFWMGGWDADALCGYVQGALVISDRRDTPADAEAARTRGSDMGHSFRP